MRGGISALDLNPERLLEKTLASPQMIGRCLKERKGYLFLFEHDRMQAIGTRIVQSEEIESGEGLRDKVVLNVVDGLQACYDGGPGANPKFIYDANVLLFGSDPVAVDAVAHDIVVKERMDRGVQQVDAAGRSAFLEIAAGLGLGIAARDKLEIKDVSLG